MEINDPEKAKKDKDGRTNNIRRPFGVCIVPFKDIIAGIAENESNFKVLKVPADDESLHSFTRRYIMYRDLNRTRVFPENFSVKIHFVKNII